MTKPAQRPTDRLMPSLAFWLCLFIAAGLFAGVVLSPKLVTWQDIFARHSELRARLASLEHTNQHLQRVVEAFRQDPEFAAEVARLDFDAQVPGEQRLPVAPVRAFAAPPDPTPPANVAAQRAWWQPALRTLAADRSLRTLMLFTAAGLTIAAFGFFPPTTDRHDDQDDPKNVDDAAATAHEEIDDHEDW